MKAIESVEQWNQLSRKLAIYGYRIWQMQYDTKAPEGFHVWFSKVGKKYDYEVVTHSDDVYEAIVNSGVA